MGQIIRGRQGNGCTSLSSCYPSLCVVHAIWAGGKRKAVGYDVGWQSAGGHNALVSLKVGLGVTLFLASSPCDNRPAKPSSHITRKPIDIRPNVLSPPSHFPSQSSSPRLTSFLERWVKPTPEVRLTVLGLNVLGLKEVAPPHGSDQRQRLMTGQRWTFSLLLHHALEPSASVPSAGCHPLFQMLVHLVLLF